MTGESKNLQHIKVKGFKSISKLDLPMENINILIGANGVGKTNLISLFTFLGNLSQGKLKNYVESEGGAERFFHFGTRRTNQMMLDLEVGNNSYHVEFSPNLDDDSLVFNCLAPPGWVGLRASRLYDAATYLKEQLICR